jgi:hypothetical protein
MEATDSCQLDVPQAAFTNVLVWVDLSNCAVGWARPQFRPPSPLMTGSPPSPSSVGPASLFPLPDVHF